MFLSQDATHNLTISSTIFNNQPKNNYVLSQDATHNLTISSTIFNNRPKIIYVLSQDATHNLTVNNATSNYQPKIEVCFLSRCYKLFICKQRYMKLSTKK